MLASAGALPPEDGRWAYEVKWDGYRALIALEGDTMRLRSRRGTDITADFPELGRIQAPLPVLLDTEIVAFDEQGRPSFELLQSHAYAPVAVAIVVFDLLHVGDHSLLGLSYDERRAVLEDLELTGAQIPAAFLEGGAALLETTRQQGMEGVVAKRRDSTYAPGRRSDHWIKVKHVQRQSGIVVGWKPGDKGRAGHLGSLLLAVQTPRGLSFIGRVGSGIAGAELARLERLLAALASQTPTCEVPAEDARTARWVRPELVAEVQFASWTRDGRLRHPSYKGLRPDLDPEQVVRE